VSSVVAWCSAGRKPAPQLNDAARWQSRGIGQHDENAGRSSASLPSPNKLTHEPMSSESLPNVNPGVHHEAGWACKAGLTVHRIEWNANVVRCRWRAEENRIAHP